MDGSKNQEARRAYIPHARRSCTPHSGYLYIKRNTIHATTYMLCRNYRRLQCMASGKLTPSGEFITVNTNHNHPKEEDGIRGAAFKTQLREACIRERGTIQHIYEQTAERYREDAINVPFRSIRTSMLRWKNTTPNIPANLEDLAAILESGSVNAGGDCAFILGNKDFISNFRDSQYTFVDGTFKPGPGRPHFMQILTVFASYMDQAFPIIHIFMESRTRILYDAVFGYLQITFPNFVNETVVSDYETTLVDSLRASYPNATIHGCVFHYCQAILRTAHTLGIIGQMEENGNLLLKKIYALALLPAENIVPAFESLQDDIELAGISNELLEYVKKEWIDRVTPQHLSVFRQNHRTNNVIESYHKRLKNKLVKRPGLWGIMDTLIDIQNTASNDLEQLQRSGRIFKVARKNVVFNNRLNEAWDRLADGRYNVQEFIRKTLNFVEDLGVHLYDCNQDHEHPDAALEPLIPNATVPTIAARPPSPPPLSPSPPAPHTTPSIPIKPPHVVYFQGKPTVIAAVARPLPHSSSPQTPLSIPVEPPPLLYFQARPPSPHAPPSIPIGPPPLLYFQAEPSVIASRPPSPHPPSPQTPPSFPIEPPLIVQEEHPVVAARSLSPYPPSPHTPPSNPNEPPLVVQEEHPVVAARPLSPHPPSPRSPSPHTTPIPIEPPLVVDIQGEPTVVETLARPPSSHTPILEETGRFFTLLDNDEIVLEDVCRWEPRFPVIEFNEESTPSVLRCPVCHLNKVQYFMACGHAFCTSCTSTLFNVKTPKCGVCRTEWNTEPLPLYLIR